MTGPGWAGVALVYIEELHWGWIKQDVLVKCAEESGAFTINVNYQ